MEGQEAFGWSTRGVSWRLCACFIWLDMTTPPWCREKVMVYYYIHTLSCRIGNVVASHAEDCRIDSRLRLQRFKLYTRRSESTAHKGWGLRPCQLDLTTLTPLSVADCGRLQLGVPHRATSVEYCKLLIINSTFCSSRFCAGRLMAIEDLIVFNNSQHGDQNERTSVRTDISQNGHQSERTSVRTGINPNGHMTERTLDWTDIN